MTVPVELVRQQWEESHRRLAGPAPSGVAGPGVERQIRAVLDELRRRLGGPFTLAELAELYDGSARWAFDAIAERCTEPGWSRSASTAADAAFHRFSRGARDYRP